MLDQFLTDNWYLFMALAVVLGLLAQGTVAQLLYKIKSVGSAQAINLINRESAVVIDVCEPKEYQQGHLPNAINIPLSSLSSRISELEKYKGKPIVVACRGGV